MTENELTNAKTVQEIQQTLDFILIRQKDFILKLVEDGRYADAVACLDCLEELWAGCGYSYKYREVVQQIMDHLAKARKIRNTYMTENKLTNKTGAISNQP